MQNQTSPLILTFGLTDPVGAIGIQADLAAFAAMGCYGLSVITSVAVSDTTGIEELLPIDPEWVADQARAVLEDMPVAALKVGAVANVETVSAIAEIAADYPDIPLILDPFLSSLPEQGMENEDLMSGLCELLIPQATLLLCSAVELSRLAETWREASNEDLMAVDATRIIEMGCEYLFLTGTPADAHEVGNTLFDQSGVLRQDNWQRIAGSFAGAGSTLSATFAALLANGLEVQEAAFEAQEFTIAAIANAQRLGMGKLVPDRYFWARENDNAH
ncbi:MAG: putative phosphomethylpyrimidine kinase [Paucimonas sp.]|nr:putative phosphomethylpyrimidine kinase [Paucimonas sp.]